MCVLSILFMSRCLGTVSKALLMSIVARSVLLAGLLAFNHSLSDHLVVCTPFTYYYYYYYYLPFSAWPQGGIYAFYFTTTTYDSLSNYRVTCTPFTLLLPTVLCLTTGWHVRLLLYYYYLPFSAWLQGDIYAFFFTTTYHSLSDHRMACTPFTLLLFTILCLTTGWHVRLLLYYYYLPFSAWLQGDMYAFFLLLLTILCLTIEWHVHLLLYYYLLFSAWPQGGMYAFQLMDSFACSGSSILFLVFWSSVAIGWGYGAQRWVMSIVAMIGYHPGNWWAICWKYIVPVTTLVSILS